MFFAASIGCCCLLDEAVHAFDDRTKLYFQRVAGEASGGAVLDVGGDGAFDAAWVTCPSVLHDGRQYRMWYSSFYDSRSPRGGIGLAVSQDGLRWRRAGSGRAVLLPGEPGALDAGQVMGPCVLPCGAGLRMWYTGMDDVADEQHIRRYRIFAADSRDGVQWHRANDGRPVLDLGPAGAADAVQAATPAVFREGEDYRMWYAAWSPEHGHTVCSAHSGDGLQWRREGDGHPVAGLPEECYGPAVCRVQERYLMLFMRGGDNRRLLAAQSIDGRTWTVLNNARPPIAAGEADDFDAFLQGHPAMLLEQDRLRVWYTGYRREPSGHRGLRLRIGLAEASLAP